jgi:hypothetical protein
MVQRFRLNPPVSAESLTEKFGVTDYSDVRKIRERLGHARALLNHVSVKGTVGASTIYGVLSEDRNDVYVVTKKGGFWTCNCPDHVFRHLPCKHIIAAMLVEEKSGINPFK